MKTLKKAIETYGEDMQLTVAIEELSELIKEICKYKRGNNNRKNIIEEMADCYIMLEQLAMIFDIPNHAINEMVDKKITRLENRLTESEDKI